MMVIDSNEFSPVCVYLQFQTIANSLIFFHSHCWSFLWMFFDHHFPHGCWLPNARLQNCHVSRSIRISACVRACTRYRNLIATRRYKCTHVLQCTCHAQPINAHARFPIKTFNHLEIQIFAIVRNSKFWSDIPYAFVSFSQTQMNSSGCQWSHFAGLSRETTMCRIVMEMWANSKCSLIVLWSLTIACCWTIFHFMKLVRLQLNNSYALIHYSSLQQRNQIEII